MIGADSPALLQKVQWRREKTLFTILLIFDKNRNMNKQPKCEDFFLRSNGSLLTSYSPQCECVFVYVCVCARTNINRNGIQKNKNLFFPSDPEQQIKKKIVWKFVIFKNFASIFSFSLFFTFYAVILLILFVFSECYEFHFLSHKSAFFLQ